ncbi:MAG: DHA2 family efflux MFS transporter permease subunit [Chlamydiia bacterium]|nr:DHA2 family efflux MFS transporter permease subunit [Chlamydiia bacterium]
MTEKPLSGISLFIGAIALALCTFMQVLDASIANVSIPYIAGDLAVSANIGTWVITMFAVGNAISLPLTGWATRRFGSIRVILASVFLFTVFSWACGFSFSIHMLVTCRFFQGFVAGPLIPLSLSLMMMSFSKEKKNLALALWNMVAVVGPIAGPIIGGWLTYDYSWPWIFFINIPVGIFCFLAIRSIYKGKETPIERIRLDKVGLFFLAFAVSALQILLDQGQQLDWWRSHLIWVLTIVSVVSFVFLFIWESYSKDPIFDLRLFKNWNFSLGTIITALSYMLIFGSLVIAPLWLEEMMGYTASLSGLAVSTMGIVPFCTVLFVAKLMSRFPLKYLAATSFLIFGLSLLYASTFTTAVTFTDVALSRLYFGIGIGVWLAPLTAISFAHIGKDHLAMASGMFHFFRIMMGGVGTSIFVTFWARRATHHHSHLVDTINPFNPNSKALFSDLKGYGLIGKRALEKVDSIAWNQAYMLSTNDLFWMAGWTFVIFMFASLFFKNYQEKRQLVAAE